MEAVQMAYPPAMAVEEAAGAEQAWCDLVYEHARLVFKVAYSVLRNHQDAEDAVQETFLRALRHKRDLNQVRDVRAWLARVAWRIAVDRARSLHAKWPSNSGDAAPDDLSAGATSAEQTVIDAQMLGIAEKMIAGLPGDFRDVLRLSTVEELTSAEIGAVLGVPEGTVRTRLFRARQLLREKMATFLEGRRG
ncbi:MAG: RNA polymerase sigma factor [Terriglobales bacterium]